MNQLLSRSVKALLATLLVYGVLVATHRGEFWPFSIYPMFSQAGHPWSRVLVRKVTADSSAWAPSRRPLPGEPLALQAVGLKANDLAPLTNAIAAGDHSHARQMQALFSETLAQQNLLVVRVRGRIQGNEVALTYEPALLLRRDTVLINPTLAP